MRYVCYFEVLLFERYVKTIKWYLYHLCGALPLAVWFGRGYCKDWEKVGAKRTYTSWFEQLVCHLHHCCARSKAWLSSRSLIFLLFHLCSCLNVVKLFEHLVWFSLWIVAWSAGRCNECMIMSKRWRNARKFTSARRSIRNRLCFANGPVTWYCMNQSSWSTLLD